MKVTIHTTELQKGMAIEAVIDRVEGESTYHHMVSIITALVQGLVKDTTATQENVLDGLNKALTCCEDSTPEPNEVKAPPFPDFLNKLFGEMLNDEKFMSEQPKEFQDIAKKVYSQMTNPTGEGQERKSKHEQHGEGLQAKA